MVLFWVSLGIIIAGGFLPLLLKRQFLLMKTVSVFGIAAGCLLGLICAGWNLFLSGNMTASFDYLTAFSLFFTIDFLSSFFLVAIFFVSFLAVIYSFHYMDTPEKAYAMGGQIFSAAGQGRVIQRVGSPSRKVGRPPGSESLEADW